MADGTSIEWTDDSWNPIRARDRQTGKIGWHCVHASEGCRNCYAEGFNRRLGTGLDYKPALTRERVEIFVDRKILAAPLRKRRRRKIFVGSMTDVFGAFVTDAMLDQVFGAMALSPGQTYQILTKRPDRAAEYLSAPDLIDRICTAAAAIAAELPKGRRRVRLGDVVGHNAWALSNNLRSGEDFFPLPNVWIGASVEDQRNADLRRPHLAKIAAAGWLTWVSYEPALGPVDWSGWEFIKWLVAGGESGPRARAMHPAWARIACTWCTAHGIAFLFKQWGAWRWAPDRAHFKFAISPKNWMRLSSDLPGERPAFMVREGKKAAGRLLDGVEHNGYPEVAH